MFKKRSFGYWLRFVKGNQRSCDDFEYGELLSYLKDYLRSGAE